MSSQACSRVVTQSDLIAGYGCKAVALLASALDPAAEPGAEASAGRGCRALSGGTREAAALGNVEPTPARIGGQPVKDVAKRLTGDATHRWKRLIALAALRRAATLAGVAAARDARAARPCAREAGPGGRRASAP